MPAEKIQVISYCDREAQPVPQTAGKREAIQMILQRNCKGVRLLRVFVPHTLAMTWLDRISGRQ
jgi:hypothetical protein